MVAAMSVVKVASGSSGKDLGSGDPGLRLEKLKGRFLVFVDERKIPAISFFNVGWRDRKIETLFDSAIGGPGGGQFDPGSNFPSGWSGYQIFPFDREVGFCVAMLPPSASRPAAQWSVRWLVVRQKGAKLEVMDGDIDKMAVDRYGLGHGEHFLGCIDGRVIYWKDGEMDHVYWFRSDERARVHTKAIPRKAFLFLGATGGVKGGFSLLLVSESKGLFAYSPNESVVLEIEF